MTNNYFELSDKTDPNEPTVAQQPIILSAPEEQRRYSQIQQPYQWVRPNDGPKPALSANPLTRLKQLWVSDPAYRVLFVAISVVLLSSFVCVVVLANAFNQIPTSRTHGGGNSPQDAAVPVDNVPVSTPTAIPIPTPTPIPTPAPTPTPVPTSPPVAVPLTVQITNISITAQNGRNGITTLSANVITSQPRTPVTLSITYKFGGAPIGNQQTPSEITDDQGNATISWNAQFPRIFTITAQVVAIAQDQQGQQVKSPPRTIQIPGK